MYPIHFYKDRNGHEPVREYIETLSMNSSKDSRIKLHKIHNKLIEFLYNFTIFKCKYLYFH